ncbi:calcofluor white hypersensitive protein [Cryptococcus neoformans 125.91]|nr:calcofluor white hypersensitive protein [Cryptococcus neoformans var. grubii 125.91]
MTVLLAFPAKWVTQAHTLIGSLAFVVTLFVGWASGLWLPLCTNSVAKWPVEWFPSVSATIGDHAPLRAPFQILIALCATPRFFLLLVQWLVHRNPPLTNTHSGDIRNAERSSAFLVDIELLVGVARTFCCGGWVYITSRDQHDLHDLFMIFYLLLTVPWMFLSSGNANRESQHKRCLPFYGFLATIPPLMWFYYRHSALRIPGAYTYYSMFEWSLVFWDLAFDALSVLELNHLQITFIDTSSPPSQIRIAENAGQSAFYLAKSSIPEHLEDEIRIDWTSQGVGKPSPAWRQAVAWFSDVYFAICFWTVFTGLGFQLFYWSVWKLALAGSEFALAANLAGYLFAFKSAHRYLISRDGQITHRIVTIICGMGCYFFPWPAARLLGVTFGTWAGWSAMFGTWTRVKGSQEMIAEGQIIGLGMVVVMLLKYANKSTNPFWCLVNEASGGWNKTGLVLATICLAEFACRPTDLHPASPLVDSSAKKTEQQIPKPLPTKMHTRLITVGLGTLIHLLQTFMMDAGTIISWTWTGYPIKGPTLHPHAGFVIAAASVGLIAPRFALTPAWSLLGCISAYVLYFYPDWIGFYGGLGLTTYLTSITPAYIRAASACNPATTFGNALLVNIIFDVASVVTTAYAFVPLGWTLRERTDLIFGGCMLATAIGGWASNSLALPTTSELPLRTQRRTKAVAQFTLIATAFLSISSVIFGYSQVPTEKPVPYYPEHRIFSGGIWTVHFGVDKEGRDSQRRMRELVRDMQVDVLGLLETDLHRFVYGNRDLTRAIAEDLGYYVDLGPGPNKHTWGAALLSKFPIVKSSHHLLPSPHGELAPAIFATLDIHGEEVNVMVSHNGQEEDLLDRELQTTEIARILRSTESTPAVFLGYLVTRTGDRRPWPYQILMEDGKMWDIEIGDRWRWCEYIAFRGLWRIAFARVHESDITDTELQVGKFMLAKPGERVVYESNQELYWHIGESDIPQPWRMPSMFRGKGVRGHRYVIWDGPLYYMPPVQSQLRGYGWDWSNDFESAAVERV